MEYDNFVQYIKSNIETVTDKNTKINYIKEELQKNILYSIYSSNKNNDLYFLGGTNLRICYGLDRFSEDLDFAIEKPNDKYSLDELVDDINNDLCENKGFNITFKVNNNSTVRKANIKISDILYDCGVSPLKDEKILIKLEVDSNPANNAEYSSHLIKSSLGPCKIRNQNINSTFAGKIGALLLREYVKGRDYYDMYWYLDKYDHKPFNLPYLTNVIEQYNANNSETVYVPKNNKEVLNAVLEKIEHTDYKLVRNDLERFVDWNKDHINFFFESYKDNMFNKIQQYNKKLEKPSGIKSFRL